MKRIRHLNIFCPNPQENFCRHFLTGSMFFSFLTFFLNYRLSFEKLKSTKITCLCHYPRVCVCACVRACVRACDKVSFSDRKHMPIDTVTFKIKISLVVYPNLVKLSLREREREKKGSKKLFIFKIEKEKKRSNQVKSYFQP